MSSSICVNCYSYPVYVTPFSTSQFCSRTCAGLIGKAAQTAAAVKKLCSQCKTEPRFFDQRKVEYSLFCSRTCAISNADAAKATKSTETVGDKFFENREKPPLKPMYPNSGDSFITRTSPIAKPVPVESKVPLIEQKLVDPKPYLAAIALLGNPIDFYDSSFNQNTSFLGNFHPTPITCENFSFPCAEALYQAAKYIDLNQALTSKFNFKILTLFSEDSLRKSRAFVEGNSLGHAAWELGAALEAEDIAVREDWKSVNILLMENILRLKYAQNPDCAEFLRLTGNCILNERTDRDSFWGDGPLVNEIREGQNQLGYCHMRLRSEMLINNNALRSIPQTLNEALILKP